MKRTIVLCLAMLIGTSLVAFGCKKKEAVAVSPPPVEMTTPPVAAAGARIERVTTTKSVNADDSPGEAVSSFGRNDTIHISMWTANAPVGTEIRARWIGPNGDQFNEDRIVTDKAGDGYTSFYARNRTGWDVGNYRVELLLNGQPAGSASFMVK